MDRSVEDRTASDGELIAASLENPRVFSDLFERHFHRVYAYVARRFGREGIDDIVSEIFCAAFERRGSYDTEVPDAAPWLFGISSRILKRHRRRERYRLRLLARARPAGLEANADHEAEALNRLDATSLRPHLASALKRLSPADRETLLLFVWADLTYEQIAVALSIPVGTVRSRIHRSRQVLRDAMSLGSEGSPIYSTGGGPSE